MRRHVLGLLLLWSATALAQARDAPPSAPAAPSGPSGDAGPVDPYANPSTPPAPQTNAPVSQPPPPSTNVPASPESPGPSTNVPPSPESPAPSQPTPPSSSGAPAPSQQQPPPQAPVPNTTPPDAKPTPPASEQQPNPAIDKPAPAPVDQPAPPAERPAQSRSSSGAPVTSLYPPGETPPSEPPPNEPPPVAAPAPRAGIIDVASAPPACRDSGTRVSSRDHNTALAAKVSFAICTASSSIAGLSLVDAEASVNDLDHATANAFALLDEVAAAGDPRWQIVALHAEGDLLAQMTHRMLDTVPPAGAGAPQSAVALHDSRLQLLQGHLTPWNERAHKAFAQVDQLARANPQLAKNQLVANAVADSRRRMTDGLATR